MTDIKTVGVIGAGQMGSGIAHVVALGGYDVRLHDVSRERIDAGLALVEKNMARQVHRGIIDEAAMAAGLARISAAEDLALIGATDLAIEAATEVGVDAVVPWQAERSIVVWRGERAAKSRARWLGTVRAATKQSRRARVPDVEVALDGRGLADRVRGVVADGGVALVLHEDATEPIAATGLPEAGECLVVVGPEGGISDAELERLTEAGGHPVRLGPHVLRTSTAGPVALTLLCERLGRWR